MVVNFGFGNVAEQTYAKEVQVLDYVCDLPGGAGGLYCENLDSGGSVYYSDESGELVPIWNTTEVGRSSLMLAMATDECKLHSVIKEILERG